MAARAPVPDGSWQGFTAVELSRAMDCVRKRQPLIDAFAICVVGGWKLVVAPDGDFFDIRYLLEYFDRLLGPVFVLVVRL